MIYFFDDHKKVSIDQLKEMLLDGLINYPASSKELLARIHDDSIEEEFRVVMFRHLIMSDIANQKKHTLIFVEELLDPAGLHSLYFRTEITESLVALARADWLDDILKFKNGDPKMDASVDIYLQSAFHCAFSNLSQRLSPVGLKQYRQSIINIPIKKVGTFIVQMGYMNHPDFLEILLKQTSSNLIDMRKESIKALAYYDNSLIEDRACELFSDENEKDRVRMQGFLTLILKDPKKGVDLFWDELASSEDVGEEELGNIFVVLAPLLLRLGSEFWQRWLVSSINSNYQGLSLFACRFSCYQRDEKLIVPLLKKMGRESDDNFAHHVISHALEFFDDARIPESINNKFNKKPSEVILKFPDLP